ncbi:hypothetical protein [Oceanirhabdus seepicola]|uniref:Protein kinase domain-containing protein n=1 Tax=Oceanirhabdus seepicola TaxID=2828781 RepID=A0A9J6NV98_9CLOT|nr:hypothetical protein [Oceanirhabdus seepicola]MCM1988394.1 hypothetical protein [Oceanirhabdus seepicola]
MSKKKKCKESKEKFKIELYKCELVEKGKKGYTFKMPDDTKLIKVFFKEKRCNKMYEVLNKLKNYDEFPKVYYKEGNLFVMDQMKGIHIKKYIKSNGMTDEVCGKLLSLIILMKKSKFSRIDAKLKNIYIDDKGKLMVLPYKNSFTRKIDYPMNLCKGLRKLGVMNEFLEYLKNNKREFYDSWGEKVKRPDGAAYKKYKEKKSGTTDKLEKNNELKIIQFQETIDYDGYVEIRFDKYNDIEFIPFSFS